MRRDGSSHLCAARTTSARRRSGKRSQRRTSYRRSGERAERRRARRALASVLTTDGTRARVLLARGAMLTDAPNAPPPASPRRAHLARAAPRRRGVMRRRSELEFDMTDQLNEFLEGKKADRELRTVVVTRAPSSPSSSPLPTPRASASWRSSSLLPFDGRSGGARRLVSDGSGSRD